MKPWSRNKEERPDDRHLTACALADIVRDELSMRLDYDDPQGELENLEAVLDRLATVEISISAITEEVTSQANQMAEKIKVDTIQLHQRHLGRYNTILVADGNNELEDDSCGWMNLPQHAGTGRFESTIDAQVETAIEVPVDQAEVAELVNDFAKPITDLTKEIYELIPRVSFEADGSRRKAAIALARYVFKGTIKTEERVFRINDFAAQDERDRQLAKKSRKLQETLTSLIEDPVGFFASLYLAAHTDGITEHAQDTIEWNIAQRNAEILNTSGLTVYRPYHEEREEVTSAENKAVVEREEPTPEPTPEQPDHQAVGLVEMNFPWVSDESELAGLSVVRSNGQEVYLTRAMIPKFAAISVAVRENSPRDRDGLCKYERIIRHHARRLAEGDRPYKNTNSVRSLRGANFGDLPIWYTHDISPNSPRIYFTLKKLGELTDQTTAILAGRQNPINPDQLCMVILAETDKAHQLEVVKTMTGRGHKNLRRGGVGSI